MRPDWAGLSVLCNASITDYQTSVSTTATMASTVWRLLLAVFILVSAVLGHRYPGYNFGPDVYRRVKRQTFGPFVLRSLAGSDGELPLRQEIRNLEQNRDQWTLYLLGLSMMQFTNQSDPLSWYQITGMVLVGPC